MIKEMTKVSEVFFDVNVEEEQVGKSLASFYNVTVVVIVEYHIFEDHSLRRTSFPDKDLLIQDDFLHLHVAYLFDNHTQLEKNQKSKPIDLKSSVDALLPMASCEHRNEHVVKGMNDLKSILVTVDSMVKMQVRVLKRSMKECCS